MLSDNIKKYRKAKKMSQEDLAGKLHVVRQTLSKWENALSVPDADQVIALADILGVRVNDLLGTQIETLNDRSDIAEELARANERIAEYAEEKRLCAEAGKVRGQILWLTVISIVVMHIVGNELLAISLSALLVVTALIILYRNLSLLSMDFNGSGKTRSVKAVTVFDIALVILFAVFAMLIKTEGIRFNEKQEEFFAAALVSVVIIFSGLIAPKLPYNRHTGLRLPWTVQNEDAWNIAHKTLGMIAVPLGLAYLSLTFFVGNFEALTLIVVAIWIGVPGLISFLYVFNLIRR